MAGALIGALVDAQVTDPACVMAADIDSDRLSSLKAEYGISLGADNRAVFERSDVILLAVKPQILPAVIRDLAASPDFPSKDRKLIISVAAGISLRNMEEILYAGLEESAQARLPIIRVMPNTPSLVGQGMAGMAKNANATATDCQHAETIMAAAGQARWFGEKDINAVTALSGSGPAYVFYLAEAMVQGGVEVGLSREDAHALALQTIKGAATLMEKTGEEPSVLRKNVTSKGGTTEAALGVFEAKGAKSAIVEGMKAAKKRGEELAG